MGARFLGTGQEGMFKRCLIRGRLKELLHACFERCHCSGSTSHGSTPLFVDEPLGGHFDGAKDVDLVRGEASAVAVAAALLATFPAAVETEEVLRAGENVGLLAPAGLFLLHLLDLLTVLGDAVELDRFPTTVSTSGHFRRPASLLRVGVC